jgi:ribose 5-phosphate isomerase A
LTGRSTKDGGTAAATSVDDRKRRAALAALEEVESGMKLGLGTGSTAEEFVKALADRVRDGLEVITVPTSERTAALAERLGIRVTTLDAEPALDLTVDGADELDRRLRLIKGGGGALLREKIVATASKRMIVIADDSKLVETIGAFPLPIEVVPFGLAATQNEIAAIAKGLSLTGPITLRRDGKGEPYLTDGGHFILDASFGRITEPEQLASELNRVPGVVEHGLFLGIATDAMIAGRDEVVRLSAK